MPHSYASNLVHVVFSTKERRNLVPADRQERLWAYLIGIGRNHNIPVLAAGGTANHIHLLVALPQALTLAKAIQVFKANSSRWMSDHGPAFAWQEGYGAFSVSPTHAERVKDYIRRQEEHHRKRSFEDEFLAMLKKAGIAFDPQFVFG